MRTMSQVGIGPCVNAAASDLGQPGWWSLDVVRGLVGVTVDEHEISKCRSLLDLSENSIYIGTIEGFDNRRFFPRDEAEIASVEKGRVAVVLEHAQ